MRLAVIFHAVAAAALLAGCGTPPKPETVIVTERAPPPMIPAECNSAGDPKWRDVPDDDIRRSEGARNYEQNKRSVETIAGNRRVCWAGLKAHGT